MLPLRMKKAVVTLLLCFAAGKLCAADSAPAAGELTAAEQFNAAYNCLLAADEARDEGRPADAAALYKEAAGKHETLSIRFGDWQPKVVQFRLNYCRQQLEAVEKAAAAPAAAAPDPSPQESGASPFPGDRSAAAREDLRALKRTATVLLRQGDSGRVRTILLDGLRIDPDDAGVRLLMAIAQCQSGAYSDAALILGPLIDEDPKNALAHLTLGAAYVGMGRIRDAAGETAMAVAMDGSLSAAQHNMAQILARLEPADLDGARAHYRRSLELGGEPEPGLELLLRTPPPGTNAAAAFAGEGAGVTNTAADTNAAAANGPAPAAVQ